MVAVVNPKNSRATYSLAVDSGIPCCSSQDAILSTNAKYEAMVAVVAHIASNSFSVSTGKTVPSSANSSSAAGSAGHVAVGLNRLAADGSGTALAIRVAGGTSLDRLASESPETRLMIRWSGPKRSSERTVRAAAGLTATTMVSQ